MGQRNMNSVKAIALAALVGGFWLVVAMDVSSNDGRLNIEELAKELARLENANPPPKDPSVAGFRAYARGRNVIIEIIMPLRQDVTDAELAHWRAAASKEVIGKSCKKMGDSPAFANGLGYVYVYKNLAGTEVGRFPANVDTCRRR